VRQAEDDAGFHLVESAVFAPSMQQPEKLPQRDQRLLTNNLLANPVLAVDRVPVARRRDAFQQLGELVHLRQGTRRFTPK